MIQIAILIICFMIMALVVEISSLKRQMEANLIKDSSDDKDTQKKIVAIEGRIRMYEDKEKLGILLKTK